MGPRFCHAPVDETPTRKVLNPIQLDYRAGSKQLLEKHLKCLMPFNTPGPERGRWCGLGRTGARRRVQARMGPGIGLL